MGYRQASSSSSPLTVFDPFMVNQDHSDHAAETSLIYLEESCKVFCPKCLERVFADDISRVEYKLYEQYVKNLFEALDQHGSKVELRKILLTCLGKLLQMRAIETKADNELHNLMRIICKVLTNQNFDCNDYVQLSGIYSLVSSNFEIKKAVPLVSVWTTAQLLLDYGKDKMTDYRLFSARDTEVNKVSLNFMTKLVTIVETYLGLLVKTSAGCISEFIFPLCENDNPTSINPKFYIANQRTCLKYMMEHIIPNCYVYFEQFDRPLSSSEMELISALFGALKDCFQAAIRLNEDKFLDLLIKRDILLIAHTHIFRNPDRDFRKKLKSFLKFYVLHYFEDEFGTDDEFKEFKKNDEIVESNHKNAIALSICPERYQRTIFYFMMNHVARKQGSGYYNRPRVRKVIKVVEPSKLMIENSNVFMRAYLIVAAFAVDFCTENMNNFLNHVWHKMWRRSYRSAFKEQFCFSTQIFFQTFMHPNFIKLVGHDTIGDILETSHQQDMTLSKLIKFQNYRPFVSEYFQKDERAMSTINKVLIFDSQDIRFEPAVEKHKDLISYLSVTLSALFHSNLLEIINNEHTSDNQESNNLIVVMLTVIMNKCKHFELMLDDQFIDDLILALKLYYERGSRDEDCILSTYNELVTLIIKRNHPRLTKILDKLNSSILGHMFSCLNDNYREGDLVNSLANFIRTYDKLDYPLRFNVFENVMLATKAEGLFRWMMSNNTDLQKLSFRFLERVLRNETSRSKKTLIITGLLQMLYKNPDLLDMEFNFAVLLSIFDMDGVGIRYHPFIDSLLTNLKEPLKREILTKLSSEPNVRFSPALSLDSRTSSGFGEVRESVQQAINDLYYDDETNDLDVRAIPGFITGNIQNQHLSTGAEDWQRRAYETTLAHPY